MVGTIIDIETTGFLKFEIIDGNSQLSDNSEILEVGFINIDMSTKRILTSGTLYFYKPYFNIESDAQKVHGITREFIQKYENDFEKNLIALSALMQCGCIIGKNSDKFDIPFIQAFIRKHGGPKFDFSNVIGLLGMKGYNGGYVFYDNTLTSIDMQVIYRDRWRTLFNEKYGYFPMANKKGKLEEYIDVIPNGTEMVDEIYSTLNKERTTGAHGALYDATMTYIVFLEACASGAMGNNQ